jgi:hypothetical protein
MKSDKKFNIYISKKEGTRGEEEEAGLGRPG